MSDSPHRNSALVDSKSSSLNVTPILVEKDILEVNQSLKELSFDESTTSKGIVTALKETSSTASY